MATIRVGLMNAWLSIEHKGWPCGIMLRRVDNQTEPVFSTIAGDAPGSVIEATFLPNWRALNWSRAATVLPGFPTEFHASDAKYRVSLLAPRETAEAVAVACFRKFMQG